jgi:Ca2+-binding RTX toxin-like protein
MFRIPHLIGAACAIALVAAPAASAGTIAYDGDTLVVTAGSGEQNFVTFGGEQAGRISISDSGAEHSYPGDRCERLDVGYPIHCDAPARVVADFGDADDTIVVDHMVAAGTAVQIAAGPGRDSVKAIGANTRLTADGGAGDDTLRSEGGGDVLRGGAGVDELLGNGGADVLEGGDGDDRLTGDACETPAGDVLDGGAGYDVLTDWGQCGPVLDPRPVTVTVDGVADDGRPGEGDDVRDIDSLELFVPATVVGTDEADSVSVFAPADGGRSTIDGRGGDDTLTAGSGSETIAGGAGDDRVEGGWGHDTLTGGPGRDVIYGDATSAQCGGSGQSCTLPFGNDVIDARDGEADQVDCGAGQDKVTADRVDTVAANCETVDGGAVTPPGTKTARKKCTVPKVAGLKVRTAKRRIAKAGCRAVLRGRGRRVVRQSIKAGKRVPAGTTVRLKRGR